MRCTVPLAGRAVHALLRRERRGVHEAAEELVVRAALGRELGVPLHADRERVGLALDALDQALGVARADAPARADRGERLVVARDGLESAHLHDLSEARAALELDPVHDLAAVLLSTGPILGQVLQ